MNIMILSGNFKQNPTLKNGVAFGTFKTDKMYLSVVAFGEVANEVAKFNTNDHAIIEGKLTQNKYNEEWRFQVVINNIKKFETENQNQYSMPLGSDLEDVAQNEEIIGNNLDNLDMPDDDLPF